MFANLATIFCYTHVSNMKKNIGIFDRILRVIIGIALLATAFFIKSTTVALIGLFTLFEAASSWCIFYQLIGRNTCPLAVSHSKKIPLLRYYLTGMSILLVAIVLNFLASSYGWFTWYVILSSPDKLPHVSIDNWVFLLVFYPLSLAFAATTTMNKK